MPVIDWRFITTGGQFLRVSAVERVDAVGPDLALEGLRCLLAAVWVTWGGAGSSRQRHLWTWLPSNLLLLWRGSLKPSGNEVEWCWTI